MALLYMQGFEGYEDGGDRTSLDPDFNFGFGATPSIFGVASTGPTGGRYLKSSNTTTSDNSYIEIPLGGLSSATTWIIEGRIRLGRSQAGSSTYYPQAEFASFSDVSSNTMFSLAIGGSTLKAYRNGTIKAADFNFITSVWYHFAWKITFHGSTGSYELKLNGVTVLSESGLNTTATGNTRPYGLLFRTKGGMSCDVDDLIIMDDQGATFNDFTANQSAIYRVSPNANGTTNDFTGSDGNSIDNYLLVDDDFPDADVTYVESATVGQKDLYGFGAIVSSPASIEAVAVHTNAKNTDSGTRTFVHVARSGATESDSSAFSPSTDYQFHQSLYETDPATAAAWTESGLNAAEFGVKVAS